MIYNWYNLINYDDFVAMDLPSHAVEVYLEDIGLKTILITKGSYVSILYEGIFLSYNLNAENPFAFEGHAIYKDTNNDLWLGIQTT